MTYFRDIQTGIRTTLRGLSLTWRHLRQATHRRTPEGIASDNYFDQQNGLVTLQYPHEQLPVPDNGRYRLRNEIDDCIVCDKCAKICPVDCITIDAIKATEEVGRASDGSPIRLYAATFDIDMAKCCYCGLCTVVCPTECLTMDKKFDYSEYELGKLTYNFANLTPAEADAKRVLYEQFVQEKAAAKQVQAAAVSRDESAEATTAPTAPAVKVGRTPGPAFRPTARPAAKLPEPVAPETPTTVPDPAPNVTSEPEVKKRPAFMPTRKPAAPEPSAPDPKPEPTALTDVPETPALPKPKPAFRPTMKPKPTPPSATDGEQNAEKPA